MIQLLKANFAVLKNESLPISDDTRVVCEKCWSRRREEREVVAIPTIELFSCVAKVVAMSAKPLSKREQVIMC